MSKSSEMIGNLAGYPDAGVNPNVANEDGGTFDRPDTILDEPMDSTENRAVPEGVVDEQLETIEKAAEEAKVGSPKDGVPEEETVEYWKTAAEGRLGAINDLRESGRQQSANIESLRQMWLTDAKEKAAAQESQRRVRELQAEQQLYGDEVVNDPAARYLRDKMQQTQEMIERNRQHQEAQQRVVREQSNAYANQQRAQEVALGQLEDMEVELEKTHPDYKQAYDFAVNKRAEMYVQRGYTRPEAEYAVRNEEAFLFAEQMQRGGNPAKVAYDLAVQWGWKPEDAQKVEPKQDMAKLKASLGATGVSQMEGQSGHGSEARFMTQEEFFGTVPEHIRIEILGDQDKFEELGRTGKIKITW